jgi:uncharacterized RDD family membrane protein YckC
MLDLLLAIALTSVVAAIFGAWQPVTRTVTSDDGTIWTAYTYYLDATWSYSLMLFFSAWAIPLWKMRAATPAQRLLGLRVLDETEPRLLSWPRAAVRWFVLFGWTFVGIASSEMNGYRNQGLHDRWARSIVVSARKTLRPAWA